MPFRRGTFSYLAATGHTAGHVDKIEDFHIFLKEVKAILTPGGLLFLSLWNLYSMFIWRDATIIAGLKKSNLDFVITESTMRIGTKDLRMPLLFLTADFVLEQLHTCYFDIIQVCSFSFQRGNYRNEVDPEADAFLFIARN
jgi:SAM-dependent methyltransferase